MKLGEEKLAEEKQEEERREQDGQKKQNLSIKIPDATKVPQKEQPFSPQTPGTTLTAMNSSDKES